jgi:hypothetical protein
MMYLFDANILDIRVEDAILAGDLPARDVLTPCTG